MKNDLSPPPANPGLKRLRTARRLPLCRRRRQTGAGVLDAYLEGAALEVLPGRAELELQEAIHELQPEEAAVLALLAKRLKQ